MSSTRNRAARLPPRWFIHLAWKVHRGLYRSTGGRVGLSSPRPGHYGTMCLSTIGRRTGQQRSVILGYYNDGPNLVTLAMNGWDAPEPAWWLNLQARPDATVTLANGRHAVRGRAAAGEERTRLWARWQDIDDNLDAYAARRPTKTAVVILEPAPNPIPE